MLADLELIISVAQTAHALNIHHDALADEPDARGRRFGLSREDVFAAHFPNSSFEDKVRGIEYHVMPVLEERCVLDASVPP